MFVACKEEKVGVMPKQWILEHWKNKMKLKKKGSGCFNCC